MTNETRTTDGVTQTETKTSSVPPHLHEHAWLDFEQSTAITLFDGISETLTRLAKKPSAARVHESRVVLRRWHSIWKVLKEDNWNTKKYWKRVGKELKELSSLLGGLRDCDVNIETGTTLGVPEKIIKEWEEKRSTLAKQIKRHMKRLDVTTLLKNMRQFLRKRPRKLLEEYYARGEDPIDSAYHHLEPYIVRQEETARRMVESARTPEERHQLRLAIKAWRYLLVEFFGVTNLELVKAQQILGKLNDLHRVSLLLEEHKEPLARQALKKLTEQQNSLLEDFQKTSKNLPYGLRPTVSFEYAAEAKIADIEEAEEETFADDSDEHESVEAAEIHSGIEDVEQTDEILTQVDDALNESDAEAEEIRDVEHEHDTDEIHEAEAIEDIEQIEEPEEIVEAEEIKDVIEVSEN